jgi:hypothetical protein
MSDEQNFIENLLQILREFGELQYGDTVKSYWVYHRSCTRPSSAT